MTSRVTDVLAAGVCSVGHRITNESQTVTRRDRPGRYCRQCVMDAKREAAAIRTPLAASGRPSRLPDDGIVDPIAVQAAAEGRAVRLTQREVQAAVAVMVSAGQPTTLITARLRVGRATVDAVKARLRR